MAELTISPEEITAALRKYVDAYEPTVTREEIGHVTQVGEGVATVEGLPSTMANELLEFESGVEGIAFNLDVREIGCVILGDAAEIEEGHEVRRTGNILSIPVGDAFLGRVIDPLGRPVDGLGDIAATERRNLEV